MRIHLVYIGFLTLIGCRTSNLAGTYRSNCADIGFFVTTVKLHNDSTFEYSIRGDIANKTGIGTYTLADRNLELTFKKPPTYDQANLSEVLNTITTGTKNYRIGRKKLLIINEAGKIVRTAKCNSRTRRFLFWGDRYITTRKYSLKKQADNKR